MIKLLIFVLFVFYNASANEKSELIFQKIKKNHSKIELTDIDDNQIKLKKYTKKLIIINFWATWCTPCIKEIPELVELERKFADKVDVLFISVGLNSPEDVNFFLKKNNYDNIDIFIDHNLEISKNLEISQIPSTVILDKLRNEIIRSSGYIKWNSKETFDLIENL